MSDQNQNTSDTSGRNNLEDHRDVFFPSATGTVEQTNQAKVQQDPGLKQKSKVNATSSTTCKEPIPGNSNGSSQQLHALVTSQSAESVSNASNSLDMYYLSVDQPTTGTTATHADQPARPRPLIIAPQAIYAPQPMHGNFRVPDYGGLSSLDRFILNHRVATTYELVNMSSSMRMNRVGEIRSVMDNVDVIFAGGGVEER